MKKNNGSKNAPAKKEAPARVTLKWRTLDAIMGDMVESENKVEFDLVERQVVSKGGEALPSVTLTIYPSDKDFDNGIINLFGFSIRVTIRSGKSGMFVSFPSQKGKDGNYYDLVTCYDKNFHAMIKEVLAAYYNDESDGE